MIWVIKQQVFDDKLLNKARQLIKTGKYRAIGIFNYVPLQRNSDKQKN